MPPVGQGANAALLDGALLGLALAEHRDQAAAVAAYEREMHACTGCRGADERADAGSAGPAGCRPPAPGVSQGEGE